MPSEFVKKVLTYGGIAAVSIVAGVGLTAVLRPQQPEEERPPIIVHNGTVEFGSIYADSQYHEKGYWKQTGNKWQLKHDHLSGPNDTTNLVYNGTCSGTKFGKGPLKISYTDGQGSWVVELNVTGNHLQVDPPSGVDVAVDGKDPSNLIVGKVGVKTWITRIEEHGGGDYCTFTETSMPLLIIRQTR